MLRSMHDLERYTIAATDGNVGEVTDFLFDDEEWVVRYFVVETGRIGRMAEPIGALTYKRQKREICILAATPVVW